VRTICNSGLQILKIIQHSCWPEVSSAFAKKNIQLIQKMNVLSQNTIGIEVGPNGVKPLVDAEVVSFGANVAANRMFRHQISF
jgi:hypothetical protein